MAQRSLSRSQYRESPMEMLFELLAVGFVGLMVGAIVTLCIVEP